MNNLLEAALFHHSKSRPVVAVDQNKIPHYRWKHLFTDPQTEDEVRWQFGNDAHGMALVLYTPAALSSRYSRGAAEPLCSNLRGHQRRHTDDPAQSHARRADDRGGDARHRGEHRCGIGSGGAVSENGRLRQGAGGYPRGGRRPSVLMLTILGATKG